MDSYTLMVLKEHSDNLIKNNNNNILIIDELQNMINIDEENFNHLISNIKIKVAELFELSAKLNNDIDNYVIKKQNEENNNE